MNNELNNNLNNNNQQPIFPNNEPQPNVVPQPQVNVQPQNNPINNIEPMNNQTNIVQPQQPIPNNVQQPINQNINTNNTPVQPTIPNQPQQSNPQPQPENIPNNNENVNNQNLNIKSPKKKNLFLIIGIVFAVIVAIIATVLIIPNFSKDNNQNSDSNNLANNETISKNGIKKIDRDDYDNTYVLKNDGTLYVIDSFSPTNVEEMVKNVENFIITDDGMFFTTFEKKSYIINGNTIVDPETYDLIEGKNLETSEGTAALIELENIKNVVDYNLYNDETGERPILFLTEDGSVYKYIINQSTSQHSVEKVMDNVKELYGNFYNKVLVDNDNTYYAFGQNKIPSGILGTSDFSYGSNDNNYVTYNNKKELGKNLKDVTIVSNSEHIEVYTIDNTNNLSVIGFGSAYDYEQTMKDYINRIDTPLVFESNVEEVYPNIREVYLKKTDGSLWRRSFLYGSKDNKKIVDKNVKKVYLDNDYDDGIFILMENNELYAYGENTFSKFGVGKEIEKYDEPTKIFSNVSNVYVFGSGAMIVTENNEIYYSGEIYNVSKWTKLEI